MNKLIRFYNQNRYKIWIAILSVVAIIAIIRVLNNFTYMKEDTNKNVGSINNKSNNYSVIGGGKINSDITDVIIKFIELCNNSQVQEAYELLSRDCKEILYPNIEEFTQKYYNKIFSGKKSYTYQAWISQSSRYTYRIDFTENMLITGKAASTSVVDYYTIVKEDDDYKININKFIGIDDINSKESNSKIKINVKRKRIYINYEIYDIEVKNNTSSPIIVGNIQDTDNIYIEDSDGKQFFWYNLGEEKENLTVEGWLSKEISIKFNKEYSITSIIDTIIFTGIETNNNLINMSIEI